MIRGIAEAADRAISHPWAFPGYFIVRVIMAATLPTNTNTLLLSDFANGALILMAIANARRAHKMECQIAELVRVDERIDEREIEDAAGRA